MTTVQRRFLLGSRWTALLPLPASHGERHFEVVTVARRGPSYAVTVRAVLTRRHYTVPLDELRDLARWVRGWSAV